MASDSSAGTHEPVDDSTAILADSGRRSLGKYELVRKIGAGGMGTVFLAVDTQLKRTVALKVLPRERASNPTLVKRFEAEAQAAAQLKHDNIVTVYDAGNVDGHLFIALEYVEGTDVYDLVTKRGSLPVARSIEIIKQVARALEHAHKQGIVHRDIKPSNLLLTKDGVVKLTDMGLARSIDETVQTGITREGTTVGTVDYMAPEQARDSQAADIRSDIYSLGCTWYQMLTGSAPFPSGSVTNKLYAHVTKPRPDPRDLNKLVPEAVVLLMHKMMARKAKDRHQNPTELLNELEKIDLRISRDQALVLEALSDEVEGEEDAVQSGAEFRSRRTSTSQEPTTSTRDSARKPLLPPRDPSGDSSRGVRLPPAKAPGSEHRTASPNQRKDAKPSVTIPGATSLPKRTRVEENVSTDEQQGWNIELIDFKKLGIVLGLILGLGLGGWLVFSISGALDSATADVQKKPAEQPEAENQEVIARRKMVRGKQEEQPAPTSPTPEPKDSAKAPTITPKVDAAANAARARIKIGRQGEKEISPLWLADVWDPAAAKPNDADKLQFGRVDGPPSKFKSLAETLRELPGSGGHVELVGDGPFVLPSTKLESSGPLIISAAAGSHPVILLTPDREDAEQPLLEYSGSTLVLSGVHLMVVGAQLPGEKAHSMFSVRGSDLTVRNCSFTLLGRRPGQTSAIQVSGKGAGKDNHPPRVLLESVTVRGENLTAIDFAGPGADLVASNSLLLSGDAPVIRISTGRSNTEGTESRDVAPTSKVVQVALEQPVARSASVPSAPSRVLRFFSCVLAAKDVAFDFAGETSKLPGTEVQIMNSIIAAAGDAAEATFVKLTEWPDDTGEGASRSTPARLRIGMENSQVLGWKLLLKKDQGPRQTVSDVVAWQQLWGRPVDLAQFQLKAWQDAPTTDLTSVDPKKLEASLPAAGTIKASDGGKPGCDSARLVIPAAEILERGSALAERPALSVQLSESSSSSEKRPVNLDDRTNDLGKIISTGDWPDGTIFEVSGSGTKSSNPIRVQGKSFQIHFAAAAAAGLTVQFTEPKGEKQSDENRGEDDAFISVTGGTVQIVGANFRIPLTTRRQSVPWLLSVTDGSFSVRGSTFHGQLLDNPGYRGMIRWKRATAPAAGNNLAGVYEQFGHVAQSYFVTRGAIFKADLNNRALVVEHCLLVSTDQIFSLDLPADSTAQKSVLDVTHSSLSAGREFVSAAGGIAGGTSPLRVFVEDSAFLASLPSDGQTSASNHVLSFAGDLQQGHQIEWWEEATGYSEQIGSFRVNSQASGESSSNSVPRAEWPAAWGPAHVLRPLLDKDGVLLAKTLTKLTEIEAGDFRLLPNSKGTTWTVSGDAIGADIDQLPVAALKAGTTKPSAKGPKTEPKATSPRKPSF